MTLAMDVLTVADQTGIDSATLSVRDVAIDETGTTTTTGAHDACGAIALLTATSSCAEGVTEDTEHLIS